MQPDIHYTNDINNIRSSPGFYTNTNRNNVYTRLSENDAEANQTLLTERQRQEQPGFFTRWIVNPLKYVGSFFCSRRNDTPTEQENNIFISLPERVNNINSFNTLIKTRIGILIVYQNNDLDFLSNFVNSIKKEEYINDILVK